MTMIRFIIIVFGAIILSLIIIVVMKLLTFIGLPEIWAANIAAFSVMFILIGAIIGLILEIKDLFKEFVKTINENGRKKIM